MTGYNLPPGCNECDIPGNEPEYEICGDCERCDTCDVHFLDCPLGKFDIDYFD